MSGEPVPTSLLQQLLLRPGPTPSSEQGYPGASSSPALFHGTGHGAQAGHQLTEDDLSFLLWVCDQADALIAAAGDNATKRSRGCSCSQHGARLDATEDPVCGKGCGLSTFTCQQTAQGERGEQQGGQQGKEAEQQASHGTAGAGDCAHGQPASCRPCRGDLRTRTPPRKRVRRNLFPDFQADAGQQGALQEQARAKQQRNMLDEGDDVQHQQEQGRVHRESQRQPWQVFCGFQQHQQLQQGVQEVQQGQQSMGRQPQQEHGGWQPKQREDRNDQQQKPGGKPPQQEPMGQPLQQEQQAEGEAPPRPGTLAAGRQLEPRVFQRMLQLLQPPQQQQGEGAGVMPLPLGFAGMQLLAGLAGGADDARDPRLLLLQPDPNHQQGQEWEHGAHDVIPGGPGRPRQRHGPARGLVRALQGVYRHVAAFPGEDMADAPDDETIHFKL